MLVPGWTFVANEPQPRALEIRAHLDRILSGDGFAGANRRSRLLRYLVEQSLGDHADALKESVIATEVFDRAPDYDPQVDSVVRVEVSRLRARLAEYYDKAGSAEPVRIEIPKGGYRPVFVFREAPARRRRWEVYAAVVLAVFGLAWGAWVLRPSNPVSIAVLPFLNLSGNASEDYLSDGISDVLTEALAEFKDLAVVARTSAFQYKGKNADMREIGRKLNAGALLEGSIAGSNGRYHVIAQLIRASDGYHLWSQSYDASLADIPAVENAIAHAAQEKLSPSLRKVAAAPEIPMTRNPEAHDLYIRAVYEMNRRDVASTKDAIGLARQAAEKDPAFAQPYVAMAAGESQLNTLMAQSAHESAGKAWDDIERALARDPNNSAAHAQKALLAYTDRWDWPQAEREFRLSLASGSRGSAENLYGWCLMTRGRFEEARRRLQAAAELDPLSLGPRLNQVEESVAERNYTEAKVRVDQILKTAPTNPIAVSLALSIAYWRQDCPTAASISHGIIALYPLSVGAHVGRWGSEQVCPGSPADPKAALDALVRAGSGAPFIIASAYAALNDSADALKYLDRVTEAREPALMVIKIDRSFDPIRKDARFIALEKRIGLLD